MPKENKLINIFIQINVNSHILPFIPVSLFLAKTGDMEHHPGPAVAALMKLSFDEEHRHAICCLGKCCPS